MFTIRADSPLDENISGEVYLLTLANALVDQPDSHFESGDSFTTVKAANGVPIFNPIKNDGQTDMLLAIEREAIH